MIKIENVEVMGWEATIRGMRNPMNSWEKSDTCFGDIPCYNCDEHIPGTAHCNMTKHGGGHQIGKNDLGLMMKLRNAGTDHRKFMRMITVYLDIMAPLYWWQEFDTYKVGTVANSCSTMHKIADKEFTLEDFSCEHLLSWNDDFTADCVINYYHTPDGYPAGDVPLGILRNTVKILNKAREKYLEAKTKPMKEETKRTVLMKKYWWQMIQLLPSSYNQRRTVMLNYEVLANIYKTRKNHQLDEWRELCKWIEGLPYSGLITGELEAEVNI